MEPNYEYEAKVGDKVLYKGKEALVVEVDEDIYDAKILIGERLRWVKQSELQLK